ncbi:RedY protein [Spartinivicinus ruber]|uniref:RedY protein n=1 Tax=Spartinivicinus ruber TaxID=2683272 RepID=UPI001CA434B7|nr:RedY protein [Spartinivicinus ruber]
MLIIHKIKLKDGVTSLDFENWVKEKDYIACSSLKGVNRFAVHRVQGNSDGVDYVEIIFVNNLNRFEQDMQTTLFKSLENDFFALAVVVEEVKLDLVSPGYNWI